jgi:CRISPR-associated endonuclease Csn1
MPSGISRRHTDSTYRLGLDMGSGSIGWAAVLESDREPTQILAMGVRRFEAGVQGDIEQGKDESRATARREARGPRRLTWRRQYRLRKLFRLLQTMDLLPPSRDDSHDERHRVLAEFDRQFRQSPQCRDPQAAHCMLPYLLRARALDQKLSRHELGRAVYHLAQRRGFLSNLKAAKKDEDVGLVKKGISELEQLIEQSGARTLAEYFARLDPEQQRIRGRWTSRRMYQEEFEKIWSAQAPHHQDLTDQHKQQLYNAIFHQRPLKSQKGLIGMCELEPYRRRAPTACLEYQEFRILQKLNDLEVIQPDGECRPLDADEREKLLAEMAEKPEVTFGRMRTLFGMKKSREYGRNYIFNFEEGGEKHLVGNRTAAKLVGALGDRWRQMGAQDQKRLVDEVLSFESEEPLITRLTTGWGFDVPSARAVAQTVFEPGYGSLSRRAVSRLLPLLRHGMPYATARKELYGKEQQPLDRLPAKHDCAVLSQLRNPAVERALSELRKVVNALIRRYGKPREIHIELARDLKHARQRRKSMADQNRQNEKARSEAAQRILAEMKDERYGGKTNILKARLAEECNWECPYTGRSMCMEALVGDRPQFDIEHIIPFSRSLDNSFFNKTLCYIDENRKRKQNRTPFEAYHGTPQWEEILARVRRFQGDARVRRRKLGLFQTEKLPDTEEFSDRLLNDTRYMSRLAGDYLGLLFGGQIDVQGKRRVHVSPGRVTAYLRGRWNLNSILGDPDQKERADHRHHGVDALVVALTGAREVQLLSRAAEEAERLGLTGLFPRGEDAFEPPWEGFLDQAHQARDAINVSSRITRKLRGKLHDETILSKPKPILDGEGRPILDKHGQPLGVHHVRKELGKLTKDMVADIVDDRIREIVQKHLEQNGGDLKKAFADPNNHPYMKSKDGRLIPIHKVRIRRSDKPMVVGKGTKQRYVNPGSNHHMEIVGVLDKEGKEKKWEGHIVSLFEAVARHRAGEPVIRRDHGDRMTFKFSLAGDEHVEMEFQSGKKELYRVVVISGNQVEFRLHTDARPSTLVKKIPGARVRLSADSLRKGKARKVAVDPLGNVFPAND